MDSLEKENLDHSLCRFIPEVTCKHGSGPFLGITLYQMIVGIQKYLKINKKKWKLIEGDEFEDMRTILDNIMQVQTATNISVIKCQADLITYKQEDALWAKGILGK